jgi:glutamine amidotransferase
MSTPNITIVDYGLGNLMSVSQAVTQVGGNPILTSDPEVVAAAERIILPGVGAFAVAMGFLEELGLDQALTDANSRGTPLLGICLGMQLLFSESLEFGQTAGLGFIDGTVRPVVGSAADGLGVRSTHIGWRSLDVAEAGIGHPLLVGTESNDSVYFVHSYSGHSTNPSNTLATVDYAGAAIAAVVGAGNVLGVQFHPEKSGPAGLRILGNFCGS